MLEQAKRVKLRQQKAMVQIDKKKPPLLAITDGNTLVRASSLNQRRRHIVEGRNDTKSNASSNRNMN